MKRRTISEQLRNFIEKDGRSRRQICLDCELDPSQMHRFLKKTGRLTNESMDRLASTLKLRLVKEGE